jgi:hypothetical protein
VRAGVAREAQALVTKLIARTVLLAGVLAVAACQSAATRSGADEIDAELRWTTSETCRPDEGEFGCHYLEVHNTGRRTLSFAVLESARTPYLHPHQLTFEQRVPGPVEHEWSPINPQMDEFGPSSWIRIAPGESRVFDLPMWEPGRADAGTEIRLTLHCWKPRDDFPVRLR